MTEFTPDQLRAAGEQIQAPPVGVTPPAEADVAAQAQAAGAAAVEVDPAELLAAIRALQTQVANLEAERQARHVPGIVGAAESLASLVKTHLTGISHRALQSRDTTALARLADDAVDAAKNAVTSGDTTAVRKVAAQVARGLAAINPGGGDHPYYTQAVAHATFHLPEAADKITGPQPSSAPALAGGAPARVIAGSVTG